MDLFYKIADEAQAYIKHSYLHLWGEPTLNRHLPEMIARFKRFSTIDLATHGLALTESMADAISQCDTISVSIDGITQEVYETYRVGGQLDDAMRGLQLLLSKAGSKVIWTFVVFRENEHQIDQAQQIANALGVRVGFKPSILWDRSKMGSIPTEEKYRRYTLVNDTWQLKADRSKCREFWETVYVLPSGDVVTCCYDGAAQYKVGNITHRSLLDVWNDAPYTAMRERHLSGALNELCSRQCQLPA